ncbi:MAG: hypothetical protein JWR83_977 [Aeromicrobium sp.]|nr:hypothetical protein [Aeromicrobium sp.]
MSGHGLRIVSDPRWIVAIAGQDVAAEVALQIGAEAVANTAEGASFLAAAAGVLEEAFVGDAWWAGALIFEEGGEAVVVRSTLSWSGPAEESLTAQDIFDVLTADSRDSEYVSELGLIETQLGLAVRHRQVLVYGDGSVGDYIGYSIPYANGVLAMQTFSTAIGWASFFGPMVEAMVLSLAPDAQNAFGEVSLLAYVAAGEER